jgi:hypothetical protein
VISSGTIAVCQIRENRLIGTNPQVKNFVTSIPAKQEQNKGGRRVIIVEILISGPGGINNLRQSSGYHFIEVR